LKLCEKILDLLRAESEAGHTDISPRFLSAISDAIFDFYEIEDKKVQAWIESLSPYSCGGTT